MMDKQEHLDFLKKVFGQVLCKLKVPRMPSNKNISKLMERQTRLKKDRPHWAKRVSSEIAE